jgi:sphinganine-1-phosphate aldolase
MAEAYLCALPACGRPPAAVLAELAGLLPHHTGAASIAASDDLPDGIRGARKVAEIAYIAFLDEKILPPQISPGVLAMERAVIAAVGERLGGVSRTPGIFTSGGSESILLAMKAARDAWVSAHPDRSAVPVIVVPSTAHPAFHKAADYLGLRVRSVPVDADTYQADPASMAAAVSADTVMVGVSAPTACHGVVDPVPDIAAITADRGVPCHVDACAGGWVLPWLAEAGAVIPRFDLSVPGVTSISADLHKFGPVPPMASVLLFRDEEMRRRVYTVCARWPGYSVVTSTVASSRSAGPVAATWAALRCVGADGYRYLGAVAAEAIAACRTVLSSTRGLRVLGDPRGMCISFAADGLDTFEFADEARIRGAPVTAYLGHEGASPILQANVTNLNRHDVESLAPVLTAAMAAERRVANASPVPTQAMAIPDLAKLDDARFAALLEEFGSAATGVPGPTTSGHPGQATGPGSSIRTASINRFLNALPTAEREELVLRYTAALYGGWLNSEGEDSTQRSD